MTRVVATSSLLLVTLFVQSASAHYLWVVVDPKAGEQGVAHLYFEHSPAPGDGHYLDPFVEKGVMWLRTTASEKPVKLEMTETKQPNKRWLTAKLNAQPPRAIESYGKYGVYRYGETDVLLHYYARHLEVRSAEQLARFSRAEHLALDLVPRVADDGRMAVKVLWKGEPAAGRSLTVRGPAKFREKVTTDEAGVATFQPQDRGRYTLYTNVEERDRSGTDDGKKYDMVRHHATMIVNLPVAEK